jgi:methyl-accepting chemotaxis protein
MNTNYPETANDEREMTSIIGLRGRLFAGFGALLLVLIIATSVVLYKIHQTQVIAGKVIGVTLPVYDTFHDLTAKIYIVQGAAESLRYASDPKVKDATLNLWTAIDKISSIVDSYTSSWNVSQVNQWHDMHTQISQLKSLEMQIINNPSLAASLIPKIEQQADSLLTILDGPLDGNHTRNGGMLQDYLNTLEAGSADIVAHMNALQYIEYVLLVMVIVLSVIISGYTTHSILQYINIFRSQSRRVASGDLTQRISIKSSDEMGMLGKDLNAMTEGLSVITRQIAESCHDMVSMLTEVKHAVDTQSVGASEQASSINEITSSLEEIEKNSMQTIKKAKALGEAAERTRTKGELGLQAVEQSINGMKMVREKVQIISETILELSNQTQQVGEITGVVNMLAQQSKMLALNASIEAAKAGEAGKGFSVVAAEVKNLAEQSEQSTTQVQKILEDIRHATEKAVLAMEEGTKGVDVGTGLVEQTGEIVRSLSDVIHDATIASQQIEAAIRQEGIGIEQITAGMNEINQVTASSVEGVKQTTEAINNLGNIANTLKKYTDTYKV